MSLKAATTASVEIPAKNPEVTGVSPRNRPSTTPMATATSTLVRNSVPPFFTMYGVWRTSMVAPMQT